MRARVSIIATTLCMTSSPALGIELGDVTVEKQQLVVYILIGHSNMAGLSEIADYEIHPRGWHLTIPDHQWKPATAPLNPAPIGDGTHGGPGMPFIKEMVKLFPEHYIGVLQNARGSATVRMPVHGIDRNYQKGSRIYDETIAAARVASEQATLGGIICMLGMMESSTPKDQNLDGEYAKTFSDDIQEMVASIRADLKQPKMPFLIGTYEESAVTQQPHRDIVSAEIEKIPSKVPYSAIIDSEGPYVDECCHFTYEGHVKWARAAAAIIVDKGWFPGTEPTEEGGLESGVENSEADASAVRDAGVASSSSPALANEVYMNDAPKLTGGCGLAAPSEPQRSSSSGFGWVLLGLLGLILQKCSRRR